ncbi:succinyl-diaminopimelate desuccinylase [Buchnera aphidicola]|uniref:Succinyl-diaminopimelate desuccinylase n=1 Tax=Buchnera aphidicola (Aphis gossypii) TaxID=98785 RepID=A0A5J6ZD29_9GAMM|nr:succinyl-diaminopimelate desuccinylase [Buchnera aphidicola]QFQ31943.1 succinyl-diaminopimelate desuccinylase [Buchnera aphidicola (Aphis gossypii)]UPT14475.1 succinyl-diaminopimelate desuccinylase [Buchnera aphidicola (Aphis gossypii)]
MICSVTELSKKLIRIPSISPKDLGCQDIIINFLSKLGFKIKEININDTKNFWATRGLGKTLTFAGHTDVVPPGEYKHWNNNPFDPIVKNGVLFGRGASDMKGALAAMLIASKRFIEKYSNHKGRLSFLITSDEESSAIDGTTKIVDYLIAKKEVIDYCIIGEPTSINKIGDCIKNGRRGSLTADLEILGIQGHIAYPHLADNPIHKGLPIILKLLSMSLDQGNTFFSPTSINVSNIHAGNGNSNIIPASLLIQFNFRFSNEVSENQIKLKFIEILEKNNVNYSIKWHLSGLPFVTKEGLLTKIVMESISSIAKNKPIVSTDGGTSDGRFIAKLNPEIIEVGLTSNTIHKVNECVKISDLKTLALIYEDIMEKLFI